MDIVNNFEGATHANNATGEAVKATRWKKDGDHPMVERYPIERRDYKGLLTVSAKEKYALHFGDVILEDAAGRVWVVSGQPQTATRDDPVVGAPEGTFVRRSIKAPSDFDQRFSELKAAK